MMDYEIDNFGKVFPDELQLRVLDFNKNLSDKIIGQTSKLYLSNWVKILKERNDDEADEEMDQSKLESNLDLNDETQNQTLNPERTNKASAKEQEALISEWGSPFDNGGDVWKNLVNEDKGDASNRGEIRFDMAYFPFTPLDKEEKSDTGSEDKSEKKSSSESQTEKLKETDLLKLTTGVITIKVHQAKELSCNKHGCPQLSISLLGLKNPNSPDSTVAESQIIRKTNSPVWGQSFSLFISDTSVASLKFQVKDIRDGTSLGYFSVPVQSVINKVR
jgi:Ca2+-dependent lipid-binding protein